MLVCEKRLSCQTLMMIATKLLVITIFGYNLDAMFFVCCLLYCARTEALLHSSLSVSNTTEEICVILLLAAAVKI